MPELQNKTHRREVGNLLRRIEEVCQRDADENYDIAAKLENAARVNELREELLGE